MRFRNVGKDRSCGIHDCSCQCLLHWEHCTTLLTYCTRALGLQTMVQDPNLPMLLCFYFHGYLKSGWAAPTNIIQTGFPHTNTRRAVVITSGNVAHASYPVCNITGTNTEFDREGLINYIIYTLSVGFQCRYRNASLNRKHNFVPEIYVYRYGIKNNE